MSTSLPSASPRPSPAAVRAGEISVTADDGEYELGPGDALEARAPRALSWVAAGTEPVSAIWASVSSRDPSHR